MGAARLDGGGRGGASCRGPRHRLSAANAGCVRSVAAGCLYRRRFPACVLSALSRLSQVLPALGAGALPQPAAHQRRTHHVRYVMILAVVGLQRERRIVAGSGVEVIVGGGDRTRLEALLESHVAKARGVLSIGIAGGLSPQLRAGDWVLADTVLAAGQPIPTDAPWTKRLAARLPDVSTGLLAGVEAIV